LETDIFIFLARHDTVMGHKLVQLHFHTPFAVAHKPIQCAGVLLPERIISLLIGSSNV
jgi:hypothetical protein